jgi:hypothetical protein
MESFVSQSGKVLLANHGKFCLPIRESFVSQSGKVLLANQGKFC